MENFFGEFFFSFNKKFWILVEICFLWGMFWIKIKERCWYFVWFFIGVCLFVLVDNVCVVVREILGIFICYLEIWEIVG